MTSEHCFLLSSFLHGRPSFILVRPDQTLSNLSWTFTVQAVLKLNAIVLFLIGTSLCEVLIFNELQFKFSQLAQKYLL